MLIFLQDKTETGILYCFVTKISKICTFFSFIFLSNET